MVRHRIPLLSLTVIAVAYCCPPPSRADLHMDDSAAHAARWREVYDGLPSCWKSERTIAVRELSDEEMIDFITRHGGNATANRSGAWSTVDGCYQKGCRGATVAGTIRLCVESDSVDAQLVFAHEYAHFIWSEKLTRANRAAFRRLWLQQKRSGHLITNYARDSPEEGFAESAGFFVRQASVLLDRDPASYSFLRGLVMDGMRHTLDGRR